MIKLTVENCTIYFQATIDIADTSAVLIQSVCESCCNVKSHTLQFASLACNFNFLRPKNVCDINFL